ncbi:hypothetical protein [Sphingomicrobium clamense]|uniref:Uncharacterized protein n=1 Tax=Sphingomicrobium clamense TaxID=2851013 RepID=A0ABS6V516_9SPHN|nr:hypothetical protein [Sphingomicrobium sp. B8]MBW0144643.1 hypothetical protein [Sphingomicrobium sp. B8]
MARAVGWILDEEQRSALLERFPPRYDRVIAHHVTLWGNRKGAQPPKPASITLVGHVDNGSDLECYVASVEGETRRPDGSIYHVTWSLDPDSGVQPKHSNDLLAKKDWSALSEPIPLVTRPDYL